MNQIILKVAIPFLLLFGFTVANAQRTVTIGSEALNEKAVLTLVTATGDQGFILPVVKDRNDISVRALYKPKRPKLMISRQGYQNSRHY